LQDFGSNLEEGLHQDTTILKTIDLTLEALRFANNEQVHKTAQGVKELLSSIINKPGANIEIGGKTITFANVVHLLELAVRLAWLADLQEERADWLSQYSEFADQNRYLESEQKEAFMQVIAESKETVTQRGEILSDFIEDRTVNLSVQYVKKEFVRNWMTWGAKESTNRVAGTLVAAAGTVTLALTLGNFLYGLDDLYNNFVIAVRSNELREKFYTYRIELQNEARNSSSDYEAELASQFRITYLLETLAAAQGFRSYSDGVEGSLNGGFLGVLNPVNWRKGDEWGQAITGLRIEADNLEIDVDKTIGHPEFIDTAVSLIWQRLAVLALPLGTCDINRNDGIDIHEESIDDNDYYVVCVNLDNPYIRFQTVMANDVPNVNAVPDQRESVSNMVSRPPYNLRHPIVAFNADYFGGGHGAEGFTVVNGDRIDGPDSNDYDGGEVNRISQAISRINNVEFDFKTAEEVTDPFLHLSKFYNATGGGPTLVSDGRLIPDPCPREGFSNFDECRQTRQTAVGVTQDGNTYIIIVAENKTGREMGELLMQYGAYRGMKLDGGSSSQLWYRGNPKIESGGVANAILIFREEIPRHDSLILEQSQFPVVQAGEPFTITIRLANTGFLPWESQLDYALKHVDGDRFGIDSDIFLPPPITVATHYDTTFTLKGTAPILPGAYQSIWQMVYQDSQGFIEPIGEEIGFLVTVIPEGSTPDFGDSIQQFIDQFMDEIEGNIRDYLDELQKEIEDRIRAELIKLIPPELRCFFGLSVIMTNAWGLSLWRRKREYDV